VGLRDDLTQEGRGASDRVQRQIRCLDLRFDPRQEVGQDPARPAGDSPSERPVTRVEVEARVCGRADHRGAVRRHGAVVRPNLGIEGQPASRNCSKGGLGRCHGRDHWARPERGQVTDQGHLASKRIKRLAQDGRCVDDEGLERDHRLRSAFHGGVARHLEMADHLDGARAGFGLRPSNSPPSNGSTGSTTAACSRASATFHPPRPRPPITHSLRPCQSPRRTQTNRPPANPGRFTT